MYARYSQKNSEAPRRIKITVKPVPFISVRAAWRKWGVRREVGEYLSYQLLKWCFTSFSLLTALDTARVQYYMEH